MRILMKYNVIDFAKYAFNSNNPNKSCAYTVTRYDSDYQYAKCIPLLTDEKEHEYIDFSSSTDYDGPREVGVFNCEECHNVYDLSELKIVDQTIHCKCGHSIRIDELRPYAVIDNYYSSSEVLALAHNVKNGTHNKFNVPTILRNSQFYCPECHKIDNIYTYVKKDGVLICTCGAHYTFDECRIEPTAGRFDPIAGGLYFNGDKIAISLIKQHRDINRHGDYYWSSGNTRVTMNLETGYTYLTNTGCCYTESNRIWKRYNKGKAPKMFNATYCELYWEHIQSLARAKVRNIIVKYANHPNLVNFLIKNLRKLESNIERKMIDEIDEYMTAYYNNKYDYRIKSYREIAQEADACVYDHDTLARLIHHNRFINADYHDLQRNLTIIFNNVKSNKLRKAFRKLNRESNTPLVDLINAFTPISKSLRKRIIADYSNKEFSLDWSDGIFLFVIIAQYFTKKENVNKLYNLLRFQSSYSAYNANEAIEFWLKYRTEEYISNIEDNREFRNKFWQMRDSISMIYNIKDVYGDDWNVESVAFHNEKQFHDALVQIIRSDAFRNVKDARRKAQMQEPFKMEESVFKLENKNITIALNEYELSKIGNEMHICVGGYGNDVRNHNCRIAYIKDNDEYVACLELRMIKKSGKVAYELHQAKLKYNNYVGTNVKYYSIVSEWCVDNNIKIRTNDMEPNFKEVKEVF